MSGLKRRLTRRRSAGPEGSEPTAAAPGPGTTPNQPPAEPEAPTSLLADPASERPAQLQPAYQPFSAGQPVPGAPYSHADPAQPSPLPGADLPPGLDPDELAAVPTTSARRGRLRKRVAFLRAARELLLRDLGGFVYELHRTAHDHEHEAHRRLRATKLDRLTGIDAELHELELLLDDVRRNVVVSEPGVGGECPECGELFGSAAHYCSHCGLPLTESARRAFSRIVAAQPGPAPVAPTDQPTQELPPLPAQAGTEFHWPPRDATPESAASEAQGDAAAAGDEPATPGDAPPTGGDVAPGSEDETASAGAGDVAERSDAGPAGDVAATSGEDAAASGDEAAPGNAASTTGDAPAAPGDDPAPSNDAGTTGDAPAARGDDPAPSNDANTTGDDPAARGDAPGDDPAPPDATAHSEPGDDAANGRQPGTGDLFSRAERRT